VLRTQVCKFLGVSVLLHVSINCSFNGYCVISSFSGYGYVVLMAYGPAVRFALYSICIAFYIHLGTFACSRFSFSFTLGDFICTWAYMFVMGFFSAVDISLINWAFNLVWGVFFYHGFSLISLGVSMHSNRFNYSGFLLSPWALVFTAGNLTVSCLLLCFGRFFFLLFTVGVDSDYGKIIS